MSLSTLLKSRNSVFSFLNGMLILPSIGGKLAIAFVGSVLFGKVNTYDADTDRAFASLPELLRLPNQITDYPINLLNHRFGEDLGLDANLNCGNWTASNC